MRINASWRHSGLRMLVLGALLAAAWMILSAVSAQASGSLPALADTAEEITGTVAAPDSAGPPAGNSSPVAAPLEPVAPAPMAAPVSSVVEDVIPAAHPIPAVGAVALAPVTAPVIELAAPVIAPVVELAAPLTSAIGDVAGPVADLTAPGAGLSTKVFTPLAEPLGLAVTTTVSGQSNSGSTPSLPAAPAAHALPDLHSSTADPANRQSLLNKISLAAAFENKYSPASRVQSPAPEPSIAPADFLVAAPGGAGSSSRAGSDAGPTVAADLTASRFSPESISLRDALRTSEELPGSVSLEHGFSPD